MPKCAECGEEHDLLDPIFRRPDAYVALDEEQQEHHAKADDDLCRIDLPDAPARTFVRCVLPVDVTGIPDGIHWGLWAEVDEPSFARVLEVWNDDDQASEPPMTARLANDVPGYGTLDLPVHIQLTGPSTRPDIVLLPTQDHEFTRLCRAGVDQHLAHVWSRHLGAGPGDHVLDAPGLRAFVCGHVAEGADVRLVVRDADGDWQFLCGGEHGGATDQPSVLDVAELVARDATLRQLGQLQPGQAAERSGPGEPWHLSR